MRRSAILPRWAAPIRTTIVPPPLANASQSVPPSAGPRSTERVWPATTVKAVTSPR